MSQHLLEFRHVIKRYPGVIALKDINFSLDKGEIVALLGENGAGKSTLVKILCGVIPHGEYEGDIVHNGKTAIYHSTKDSNKDGIAMIPQEVNFLPDLSVAENIMMGYWPMKGPVVDFSVMKKKAEEALRIIDYEIDVSKKAGLFTSGTHQMMTIARALMLNPSVLILDEPTSALSDKETEVLLNKVKELRDKGICCVYITHKLDEVFKIADRAIVFRDGNLIREYSRETMSPKKIVDDIIGSKVDNDYIHKSNLTNEIVLSVKNFAISQTYAQSKCLLKDINFDLRKGEILGIAGLLGSGRSELLRSIFGAMKRLDGELILNGEKIEIKTPEDAIEKGIGLLTEERSHDGYVRTMNVGENMSLAILKKLSNKGLIDSKKEKALIKKYFDFIHIKAPSSKTPILSLSGGNQQKVLVAKWLMNECKVLLLDEPTRGVDVGARNEIYNLLTELTASGASIIIVSSELPELVKVCDRFVVLANNTVSEIVDTADGPVSEASLMMKINAVDE